MLAFRTFTDWATAIYFRNLFYFPGFIYFYFYASLSMAMIYYFLTLGPKLLTVVYLYSLFLFFTPILGSFV